MKLLPSLISFIILSFLCSTTSTAHVDLLDCLYSRTTSSAGHSNLIYTPNSNLYSSVLQSSIRNQRFNTTHSSRKHPIAIITPHTVSQIQSAVFCSRNHGGLRLRVRSGGHDFEGLSYVSSSEPFLLIDLIHFRNVTVDVPTNSAWVQAGAVLGEVYHAIASASPNLAFPAGICPTVGVGGHISGGGYGMLLRKYGTAADNILDAQLVEDVFWAIRGGGGNTYGIVVSWKLNLVSVPSRLTVFSVSKATEENVTRVVDRYQRVADKLSDEIGMYLGKTEEVMREMKERFKELELTEGDCQEMSWIESILYFAAYPRNASYEVLLGSRSNSPIQLEKVKAKSDYVETPLPLTALHGLWKSLYEIDMEQGTFFQVIPHGGRMSRISESSIPYPRRAGNMYKIQYYAGQAKVWGEKYYNGNFQRLARVKAAIDPTNFFRNEQSVPPLFHQ
ncbi:Tetrahydroberberine oxidase [Linum grandiflorum]